MNFGFGAGDVFTLVQLAWNTLDGARQACGEHDALTREVASLHRVLQRLHREISNPDSLLNRADDDRREELREHGRGCEEILNSMNAIVSKYSKLSEKGTSAKRVWQQVRFGNDEMRDLSKIRVKLETHTSALTMSLNLCSLGSQGRVERDLNSLGGDMKGIRVKVDLIAANMAKKSGDGTVWTSYTNDDRSFWRELRRELVKEGYWSSVIHKHKRLLTSYIEELGKRGVFDHASDEGITEDGDEDERTSAMREDVSADSSGSEGGNLPGMEVKNSSSLSNDEGWSSDEEERPHGENEGPDQQRPKVENRLPKQPAIVHTRAYAKGSRSRHDVQPTNTRSTISNSQTYTSRTRDSRKKRRNSNKGFLSSLSMSFWGVTPKKPTTEQFKSERRLKCAICLADDIPQSETPKWSCGHRICISCFSGWSRRLLDNPQYTPQQCCAKMILGDVEHIINDRPRLPRELLEDMANTRFYCPSIRCGKRVKPVNPSEQDFNFKGKCTGCNMEVCLGCVRQHKSKDCTEMYRDICAAFPLLVAKLGGWQRCYNCKMLVAPQEGNGQATCVCRAQLCMACGLEWKTCNCPLVTRRHGKLANMKNDRSQGNPNIASQELRFARLGSDGTYEFFTEPRLNIVGQKKGFDTNCA